MEAHYCEGCAETSARPGILLHASILSELSRGRTWPSRHRLEQGPLAAVNNDVIALARLQASQLCANSI
jgi:hypothetical protein